MRLLSSLFVGSWLIALAPENFSNKNLAYGFWSDGNMPCKNLGEFCRKLPMGQRCCGTTSCDLYGFFKGTCVRCIPSGRFCLRSGECCSGSCRFFRCCSECKSKI
ncbi:unnamed protein product [Dicrocoelium dendriticum]|nr:unnamed protein product [Dicrocoelium dendriticum]